MRIRVTPVICYRTIRFIGKIVRSWPKDDKSSFWLFNIDYLWWFYLLNHLAILFPTIQAFQKNKADIVVASYSWIELTVICESIVVLIYSKYQSRDLMRLLIIAENQLQVEKSEIILNYTTKYAIIYIIILSNVLIVIFIFIKKPVSSDEGLILTGVYPFKIESLTLKNLLIFNQVLVLFQTGCLSNLDGIVVILVFTCTEKLKILEYDLHNAKSFHDLIKCIHEHEKILNLVKETNTVVRFIVLKTVISFMLYTFGSGLQMLNNTAASQWIHQVFILLLVYARIYLNAECADNMSNAGRDLELAVYLTSWENENIDMVKAKTMIIHRCQKLPVISVSGLMESLDRKYLAMILYATISYLMTLRAITGS